VQVRASSIFKDVMGDLIFALKEQKLHRVP
jgi:hypothetical protein